MTLQAMNPFAMLLDSTSAIQAHENVLSSLRKEVHKRADAMPRHLLPEVAEYDKAIEMGTSGRRPAARRTPTSANDEAASQAA